MRSLYQQSVDYFRKVNWMLLLFLVLVLNIKMVIKVIAILMLLFINREKLLSKRTYQRSYTWFYFGMIGIALLNLLVHFTTLSTNYLIVTAVGISFWLLCIAAAFINRWFVENTSAEILHNTITLFFILNAVVTIGQLIIIMIDAGSFNPYTYQGMHQKYFISTGDRMTGISFDVSTTNALLSSFGLVYFLSRYKMHLVLLCMTVLLLTASNFTNLLLLFVLICYLLFFSTRNQRSVIIVCLCLLGLFLVKISPQNNSYITNAYKKVAGIQNTRAAAPTSKINITEKPDSLLTIDERKEKIALLYLDSVKRAIQINQTDKDPAIVVAVTKPVIPTPSIHTAPYQRSRDTTQLQKNLISFAATALPAYDSSLRQKIDRKTPGKIIALQQTIDFFRQHPLKSITGMGMGNFSSKLAFRATGMQTAGGYPQQFIYINEDFRVNHLRLYLTYFTRDIELHSLINNPNSTYDQLFSEYGLAGIFVFLFFYIRWFISSASRKTYSIPLLLLLLGALAVDYWFEQLSIIILFELMMLLNKKELTGKNG